MASKGLGPLPRRRGSALAYGCGRGGHGVLPLPRAAAVSTRSRVLTLAVAARREVDREEGGARGEHGGDHLPEAGGAGGRVRARRARGERRGARARRRLAAAAAVHACLQRLRPARRVAVEVDDARSAALGRGLAPPHGAVQRQRTLILQLEVVAHEGHAGQVELRRAELLDAVLGARWSNDRFHQLVVSAARACVLGGSLAACS